METLDELKSWDTYRVFMRKYLKQLGSEEAAFYVSKARLDFDINGAKWKGHGILLGKKARLLAQKMRQAGEVFLLGTCCADGKTIRLGGFGDKHVQGAVRTLKKLKLGFAIADAPAEDGGAASAGDAAGDAGGDDRRQAEWSKRKARSLPALKRAIAAGGPNAGALEAKAKAMLALERLGDWAGATRALDELQPLLGRKREARKTEARRRLVQLDKTLDQLIARLQAA